MNKDLRKLQKQLEQLQKKDQTFIIKLIDKTYLVKGQKFAERTLIKIEFNRSEVK